MNNTKAIDLLRKRNAQMQEELDKLKELSIKHEKDPESRKISVLIEELENIRAEWMKVLEELNTERNEYHKLIEDLRIIKEIFKKI